MSSMASADIRWRKASSLVLLAALAACGRSEPAADLLLTGGVVVAAPEEAARAEAVATRGDKIVCVGRADDCAALAGPRTRVIELSGRTVTPGFADSHLHLSGVGFREMELNLEGVGSLDELLAALAGRVESAKPGEWISGRGWIESPVEPAGVPHS